MNVQITQEDIDQGKECGQMKSPKAMAQILTQEGFIRWTEGKALRLRDFKELAALSLRKDRT